MKVDKGNAQGTACELCLEGFWGPKCLRTCPSCYSGTCNAVTGKCNCNGQYTGPLCDRCIDGNAQGNKN